MCFAYGEAVQVDDLTDAVLTATQSFEHLSLDTWSAVPQLIAQLMAAGVRTRFCQLMHDSSVVFEALTRNRTRSSSWRGDTVITDRANAT